MNTPVGFGLAFSFELSAVSYLAGDDGETN
jgi:hypothetical protein